MTTNREFEWTTTAARFLREDSLNPTSLRVIAWNDTPYKGDTTVNIRTEPYRALQLSLGDWGYGVELVQHFQPDLGLYNSQRRGEFMHAYFVGALGMLAFLSDREMLSKVFGTSSLPKKMICTPEDAKMTLFLKRVYQQYCVVSPYGDSDILSWRISDLVNSLSVRSRLVKYARLGK